MPSLGFLRNKWPKRHEFLVEQCQALHVSEVLPYLHRLNLKLIDTYLTLSTHPYLRVVPRRGGPFKKWYFQCPWCRRPYETLYIPPAGRPNGWRCRVCWGLVYASQRYGFRHPLRKKLTHRKRLTRLKLIRRQERSRIRAMARQRKEFPAMERRYREPHRVRDEAMRSGPLDDSKATAPRPDTEAIRVQVQARIEADRERTLRRLKELADQTKDKRVQAQARRHLQRAGLLNT